MGTLSFDDDVLSPLFPPGTSEASRPRKIPGHGRSHSATSVPTSNPAMNDVDMVQMGETPLQPMLATEESFDQISYPQQSQDYRASTSLDARHYLGAFDYPSPAASNFESLAFSTGNYPSIPADSPPSMPPPVRNSAYSTPSNRPYTGSAESLYTSHKQSYSAESPATSDTYSPQPGPPTPFSPFMTMPLTPNSSVGTDDPAPRTTSMQSDTNYIPDLRRMSVQSILAGPAADGQRGLQHGRQYPIGDEEYTTYGYDRGLPDLDTPHNDDLNAIAIFSPPSGTMDLDGEGTYGRASELRSKDMAFEGGGYYAKPVPIKISKSLEPLPPLLLESPMNLLYFHHFLNHTARILVPHDCEKNPFRQILPESMFLTSQPPSTNANYHSGCQRQQHHVPPPRLLRLAPRPHARPRRTRQPHRHVGPRRLPAPPPIPRKRHLPFRHHKQHPRLSHHDGLPRNYLPKHLRGAHLVAEPPHHGPPDDHHARWTPEYGPHRPRCVLPLPLVCIPRRRGFSEWKQKRPTPRLVLLVV